MANKQIRFGPEAEERTAELVEGFKDNLRRITLRLTYHDQASSVDKRHVDQANEALVNCGLCRGSIWSSSQLKMTASNGLIGVAAFAPDIAPHISKDPEVVARIVWCGIPLCLILAVCLLA